MAVGAAILLGSAGAGGTWTGCGAGAHYDGREGAVEPLARAVAADAIAGRKPYTTGSEFFDAEWEVGKCQMTILGLGQVLDDRPDLRDELLPAMDHCAEVLVADETVAFGTELWGENGLERTHSGNGHAYLGYIALALGVHRAHRPDSPHADLHDRLIDGFVRKLDRSPHGVIETYPGQTYPPDVSSVVGAIGQHATLTGVDRSAFMTAWRAKFEASSVDPASGMLIQALDVRTGEAWDAPRSSGTALAVYFLAFADPELSAELYEALERECIGGPPWLGAVKEYPRGVSGSGDIDSGPLILGYSVSASGFALAGARIHQDRRAYTRIYRTSRTFGLPHRRDGERRYLTGGPLGNAILLAMLTAPAADR